MAIAETNAASALLPRTLSCAAAVYVVLLVCFWMVLRQVSLTTPIDHVGNLFAVFAVLFAPMWFFGFNLTRACRSLLTTPALRVIAPSILVIPYLIYAIPRGELRITFVLAFLFVGIGGCALFEYFPPNGAQLRSTALAWQDVVALLAIGLPIEFSWFRSAFPHRGLDALPKLMMVDIALYMFLVVRQAHGVGYNFQPRIRDFLVGLRELAFFAPVVISLGMFLRFITPHGGLPHISEALIALLLTFFLIAIPEELFFRGFLQNLLEPRMGRIGSLTLSSVAFGLTHFNKPGPFNWRYVLLATITGIFYGRAWRDRRRILSSATTHTLVDVLWTLWFRS